MRRINRSFLWLAIASQFLLGIAGSSFVLCQEANGEIALEWGFAGCCDTATPEEGAYVGASLVSGEECGACDDGTVDLRLQREDGALAHVLAVPPALVLRAARSVRAPAPLSAQPPRAPPGLASLKTVNLRC